MPLPETVATELGNEKGFNITLQYVNVSAYLISLLNAGKASYLTDSFIICVFLHCPPSPSSSHPFLMDKLWDYGIIGLLTSDEKSSEFRIFQNLFFLIILRK